MADPIISKLPPDALARPKYEVGGYLRAADLESEQGYRRQRLRRHNRHLHGWGVVCGFRVAAEPHGLPWQIRVCPGYALGPWGDEIYSGIPIIVDIAAFAWSRPSLTTPAYVAIRAAEHLLRPLPAPAATCGCEDTRFESSRIRDNCIVDILWTPPPKPEPRHVELCSKDPFACNPCPESPYILLASVTLPASTADPIISSN
jgi:hypothetical protein